MTEIPTVARLYYTGVGSRRYKRASTQSGPGEPLCFKSTAQEAVRRAVVAERAEVRRLTANLHELRALLDRRPAVNQGLFDAYQKWTGEVYALDWLNALDAPPAAKANT